MPRAPTSPHELPRATTRSRAPHELSRSGKSGEVYYNQHAVVRVSELMHNMQSHSDDSSKRSRTAEFEGEKNVDKSGAILFILLCYAGPGVPVGGDAPFMLHYTNTITITKIYHYHYHYCITIIIDSQSVALLFQPVILCDACHLRHSRRPHSHHHHRACSPPHRPTPPPPLSSPGGRPPRHNLRGSPDQPRRPGGWAAN